MNPLTLGLAAATMVALAACSPVTATTRTAHQPAPQLSAARQTTTPPEAAQWPVTPVTVIRPFEPHEQFGPGHRGVDLAAAPGQSVRSALAGQITFSGEVAGRPVVVIEHEGELRTTYLPVASTVAAGTYVAAGQPIGSVAVGMHCPLSTCLHWGARRDGVYLDPLTLVEHEIVLLPLDE